MVEKAKQNRYLAWGGVGAVVVVVAIVLWLAGVFEPSTIQ